MEEVLRASLVAALPGTAIDWVESDPAAGLPRVVLTRISGGEEYAHDGPVRLLRARVQIDCVAATYGAAKGLARDIRAHLSGRREGVISGVFVDAERDLGGSRASGVALQAVAVDVFVHYQE